MGIFGSFKKANQVINDAKKDVKRPKASVTNIDSKRGQKKSGGKK